MLNLHMPRREALEKLTVLLGGTLSLPALMALRGETLPTAPIALTAEQQKLIADLAEVIIPDTDTPGAKAAGVGPFIVQVVQYSTPNEQQRLFLRGLQKTNALSQTSFGKPFSELDAPQRVTIVEQLARQEKDFFLDLRELTVVGFFTSEIGATQTLEYLAIPGRFEGNLPLKSDQRTWAV